LETGYLDRTNKNHFKTHRFGVGFVIGALGKTVEEYRAYTVGDDGHFVGFEAFVCADDAEAIEKTRRLVNEHPIELWSGPRFVTRLHLTGKTHGDAGSHEIEDGRMVPKNIK
jgi:hypothetical protein